MSIAVDADGMAFVHNLLHPLPGLLRVLADYKESGLDPIAVQNFQHLGGAGRGAVIKGEVAHLCFVHTVPLMGLGIELRVKLLIRGDLRAGIFGIRDVFRVFGRHCGPWLLIVLNAAVRRRDAALYPVQLGPGLRQGGLQPHGHSGRDQNGCSKQKGNRPLHQSLNGQRAFFQPGRNFLHSLRLLHHTFLWHWPHPSSARHASTFIFLIVAPFPPYGNP